MPEAPPPAEFIPVKTDLPSEPKYAPEQAKITDPLRAFYQTTQPVVEQYVQQKNIVTELNKMGPKDTMESLKSKQMNDLDELAQSVNYFHHTERKIRGLPFDKTAAEAGLRNARKLAQDKIDNIEVNPDDARAAEIELKLLT